MRLIVTGGAGFIGANFVYFTLRAHPEDRVVCIDNLTYAGNRATLPGDNANPNFCFYRADICDRDEIARIFEDEKPDAVVNFAAETHVDRSITNPQVFVRTNVLGTQNLMDACREFHVRRYHQVSTDEVYGDLPLNRPDLLFTEQTPLRASSPYSASKAGADLLVLSYHRTFGLPATISRCSNNYGPYQFPEKLIPLMIINALSDKPLPVYGNGENVRDWLYVEDHCRAIDLILRKGVPGELYNVGGHNEMSNIEIVHAILSELHKPASLIRYVEDRKGHDLRYAVDPAKIHGTLGWLPDTMFSEGIRRTVSWYLSHRTWWEPIVSGEYRAYYKAMYGTPGEGAQ
jgi:dTDP-glucose 4,6-dehydratase